MRERITIQGLGTEIAASGTPSGAWFDVCSVRARVETLSGKEGYEANQNTARLTHLVEIRWRSGVASEMRVVWLGRVLQIHSVVEDAKRTRMILQCEERIE
jgi:SPP1 family predicted phage head-tail adaptor